uniref:RNase H type-1 domain-containing protein n=1 Tax=Chenopodium quinoa TaxID=63459 RepID=A0A803LJ48_CHEQI
MCGEILMGQQKDLQIMQEEEASYAIAGGVHKYIRSFTANFGVCNAYKAELLAAELGLQMAKTLGIPKLILQMDNKACLEAISNEAIQGAECQAETAAASGTSSTNLQQQQQPETDLSRPAAPPNGQQQQPEPRRPAAAPDSNTAQRNSS